MMTRIAEITRDGYYVEIAVSFRYGKPMWTYRVYKFTGEKVIDHYNEMESYHEDYDVVLDRAIREVEEWQRR